MPLPLLAPVPAPAVPSRVEPASVVDSRRQPPPIPPRASWLAALDWGPLAGMDASQRMLTVAVALSVVLHAVVLSIHFKLPERLSRLAAPATLDVVLVNAKSHKRPAKADVMAQANLEGGGNTDQRRVAASSRPVSSRDRRGNDLQQARQRVRELEAQQRQLLSQLKSSAASTAPTPSPATEPVPAPVSGNDLYRRSLEAVRLQGQIARQTDEYNKKPYKKFIGANADNSATAMYLVEFTRKVERIGNLNYPEMAKGKYYGKVQIQVQIKPDGSIDDVAVLRPSNYAVLNQAAEKIVRIAAPYAAIPASVLEGNDLLVFTRTVIFERGDYVSSN